MERVQNLGNLQTRVGLLRGVGGIGVDTIKENFGGSTNSSSSICYKSYYCEESFLAKYTFIIELVESRLIEGVDTSEYSN